MYKISRGAELLPTRTPVGLAEGADDPDVEVMLMDMIDLWRKKKSDEERVKSMKFNSNPFLELTRLCRCVYVSEHLTFGYPSTGYGHCSLRPKCTVWTCMSYE